MSLRIIDQSFRRVSGCALHLDQPAPVGLNDQQVGTRRAAEQLVEVRHVKSGVAQHSRYGCLEHHARAKQEVVAQIVSRRTGFTKALL